MGAPQRRTQRRAGIPHPHPRRHRHPRRSDLRFSVEKRPHAVDHRCSAFRSDPKVATKGHTDGRRLENRGGVPPLHPHSARSWGPLVTERIWSLRVGAAGGQSDRDDRDAVLYRGIACCVDRQEVSPRPGRTTVALGLRAVSDRPEHVGDGSMRRRHYSALAQHQATSSGTASSSSLTACRRSEAPDADAFANRTRCYRRLRCAGTVSTAARVR